MSTENQHCPGFEANKSLNEVKIRCPQCGKEWEIFSDEVEKNQTCSACNTAVDPKSCQVK